jgi:hypothetical protein
MDTSAEDSNTKGFEWKGQQDRRPPLPHRTRVMGTCTFPTSGYSARLVRREPQGFNPRILDLALLVEPPSGGSSDVLTDVAVTYEEETEQEHDQAQIFTDDSGTGTLVDLEITV